MIWFDLPPYPPVTPDNGVNWLWIVVAVVVLAAIVGIVMLLAKRRKG